MNLGTKRITCEVWEFREPHTRFFRIGGTCVWSGEGIIAMKTASQTAICTIVLHCCGVFHANPPSPTLTTYAPAHAAPYQPKRHSRSGSQWRRKDTHTHACTRWRYANAIYVGLLSTGSPKLFGASCSCSSCGLPVPVQVVVCVLNHARAGTDPAHNDHVSPSISSYRCCLSHTSKTTQRKEASSPAEHVECIAEYVL